MNCTDTHTLELKHGDTLKIIFETVQGSLEMKITAPDGTALYQRRRNRDGIHCNGAFGRSPTRLLSWGRRQKATSTLMWKESRAARAKWKKGGEDEIEAEPYPGADAVELFESSRGYDNGI